MDKVSQPLPCSHNKFLQLRNTGLSCTIDSVLVALLCIKCTFTDQMMATDSDLGRELANLTTSSATLCELLNHKELSVNQCRDPHEFLSVFLSKFPKLNTCTKLFQTIVDDDKIITSVVDRTSLPIQHISASDLNDMPNHFYISDLLHKGTLNTFDHDQLYLRKYSRVLTVERLLTAPLIVFSVDRHNDKSITVTETLTSPNGDRFQFGSVVVYTGGHYITYYTNNSKWWKFDNVNQCPVYVGPFSKLPSTISTAGVLYFYFPQYMSVNDYFLFYSTQENDMVIGVFENKSNPKLIQMANEYNNVAVSPLLPDIGVKPKQGQGPCLEIKTIDEYVIDARRTI